MDDRGRLWDVGAVIDLATNRITELTSSEGFDIGGGWIGAYARTEDGHLLFGGPQGLLVVQPDAFMPWDFQPPVVISSLLIDGEPRPAAGVDHLTLSPKIRGFSVEFAALDFSDPDSLQYAYRLDGFDPDWTEAPVERRVATFTNLDPGQYTLRVKATNRLGEWSQKQLALVVTAEPAFYETLWFRTLIVLLILLGLYAIYLVRIRQLAARSRHLESVVRERTASLALANAELAELARTDVLTQLANRRAFLEEATAEVHRMHRSGRPFSIVLGDIDLFKSINDRHGHSAGDTVLVTVASVFRQQIRTQDTVARWGGEEMIFLLPETDLESAHCAAEKWREAVEAAKVTSGDATLRVTMTFGVSQIQQGEVIGRCIQRADAALYAGKNSGRNKVVSAAMEG
jgi:diguanylate cyclase (GGDEF)-like protein